MSEYTPTTDEVVDAASCSYDGHYFDQIVEDDELGYREVPVYAARAVRRWLAAHDAEVAAAEREACARIADEHAVWHDPLPTLQQVRGHREAGEQIADDIRARESGGSGND